MPLDKIRARTAARKLAGLIPVYPQPVAAKVAPCPLLGAPTGETVPCQSCKGTVELKVLACAHPKHGRCTPTKKVDGIACCLGCADRPKEAP